MRLRSVSTVVACHAAAALSDSAHAFVCSPSNAVAPAGRRSVVDVTNEQLEAALIDLRGGKTVGSKKSESGSKSKSSSFKGKSAKKSKKKSSKPSFMATVKAFFVSLINPHFALKLQAKQKNQIHTVHGSSSTDTA